MPAREKWRTGFIGVAMMAALSSCWALQSQPSFVFDATTLSEPTFPPESSPQTPERPRFAYEGKIQTLTYSPDGKLIAWASERAIHVWNIQADPDFQRLKTLAIPWAISIAFLPDGSEFVSASMDDDVGLTFWDTRDWTLLRVPDLPRFARAMDISPDGKTCAVGILSFPTRDKLRLFDVSTGMELHGPLRRYMLVDDLDYTADGRALAIAHKGKVLLVSTIDGKEIREFEARGHYYGRIALSRDGKFIAGGGGTERLLSGKWPRGRVIPLLENTTGKYGTFCLPRKVSYWSPRAMTRISDFGIFRDMKRDADSKATTVPSWRWRFHPMERRLLLGGEMQLSASGML